MTFFPEGLWWQSWNNMLCKITNTVQSSQRG